MNGEMIVAFGLYCVVLLLIGFIAYRRNSSSTDFIIGSRSLSYWVTALAAHASDMSGWLFMAFPAAVFLRGVPEVWTAIGLLVFMFLNWWFVAPKLRSVTEQYQSLTLPSFFEKRFNDQSGVVRVVGAFFCLLFFMFYISAGLMVLGNLFQAIFNISYLAGITVGSLVVFYILLGGYLSIAWIDFFQGLFLLAMILLVPAVAYGKIGGSAAIVNAAHLRGVSLHLMPGYSWSGVLNIVLAAAGWGLGYFGMPHIITKFMGIRDVREMRKAMYVGLTWQSITLAAAIAVGLVGLAYFPAALANPELLFVEMTKGLFRPFFAGLILCAIVASAINVMGAQVLASASVLGEDLFGRLMLRSSSAAVVERRVAWASRASVVAICCLAFAVAFYNRQQTIYDFVLYAWTGLGCSFGPLVLVALHTKIKSRRAAVAGMVIGGTTAAVWPLLGLAGHAMIPGFGLSLLGMAIVYWMEW